MWKSYGICSESVALERFAVHSDVMSSSGIAAWHADDAEMAAPAAHLVDAVRAVTSTPEKFPREGHHGRSY